MCGKVCFWQGQANSCLPPTPNCPAETRCQAVGLLEKWYPKVLMRACFEGEPPLCIGCFCSVSGDQSEHSISGGFLSPLGALPWIWGVLCPCWRGRGRRLPYTEGRRCCLSASAQCCACFLGTGLPACCRNWTPVLHDCTWP